MFAQNDIMNLVCEGVSNERGKENVVLYPSTLFFVVEWKDISRLHSL